MAVASPARLQSAALQSGLGITRRCSLRVSASVVRMVDNRRPVEISETVANLSASRRQALLGFTTLGISLIASQSPSEASSRTAGRLKALEKLRKQREETEETAAEEADRSEESAVVEDTPAAAADVPSSTDSEPTVAEIEPPSVESSPVESVEETKTPLEEITESVVESVEEAGNIVESVQETGTIVESVPEPASVTESLPEAENVAETVVESVAETPSEEKVADEASKPSGVMDLKALIEKGKGGESGGFTGKITLSDFKSS